MNPVHSLIIVTVPLLLRTVTSPMNISDYCLIMSDSMKCDNKIVSTVAIVGD